MTIKLAVSSLAIPDCNQAPYADRKKKEKGKTVYFQRNHDFVIFFLTYNLFIWKKAFWFSVSSVAYFSPLLNCKSLSKSNSLFRDSIEFT